MFYILDLLLGCSGWTLRPGMLDRSNVLSSKALIFLNISALLWVFWTESACLKQKYVTFMNKSFVTWLQNVTCLRSVAIVTKAITADSIAFYCNSIFAISNLNNLILLFSSSWYGSIYIYRMLIWIFQISKANPQLAVIFQFPSILTT